MCLNRDPCLIRRWLNVKRKAEWGSRDPTILTCTVNHITLYLPS